MKKLIFLFLTLGLTLNCYAGEVITSYDNETLPVLNDELRQISSDISSVSASLTTVIPTGVIAMWAGSIASIPSGWALCDGTNGTPDLRDRFIIAATADDGGVAKTNVTGSLTQSGNGTIPSHTHIAANESEHTHIERIGGVQVGYGSAAAIASSGWAAGTANRQNYEITAAGTAHTHTIAANGTGTLNIAVYYALAYIMKL